MGKDKPTKEPPPPPPPPKTRMVKGNVEKTDTPKVIKPGNKKK
jgi:hypothetical protein